MSCIALRNFRVIHGISKLNPSIFFNVGFQTIEEGNKAVKPLAAFSTDPQKIVHEPFIDYETGEIKQGVQYFKPLSKTILQYIDHPESKYDGDIGLLERKHIQADGVSYIGKEANNIDEQPLEVQGAQVFINEEKLMKKILDMTQKQAIEYGIDKSTFQRMKRRIEKDHEINLNTPAIKRLMAKVV
jgi:hypothetical protein